MQPIIIYHMNSRSQIEQYNNQDFKNLYRHIKSLNLLNQLYDSDAITSEEFEQEEKEIMDRYKRLVRHVGDQDLKSFAKLYSIEKEFNRIVKQDMNNANSNKELLSVCLTLGSKFPEVQDIIHTSKESREVKDVLNVLSQMVILLDKYMKLQKNVGKDLRMLIERLKNIFVECRKKNINDQFTPYEYFELEDIIAKLVLEFNTIV